MRWKLITGFDGRYRVSDTGIVQSCHKWGSRTGERSRWRNMTGQDNQRGYLRLNLCVGGGSRSHYIHRLVAGSFLENTRGLPAINHLDGDKSNNHVTNLEWCTNKQNTRHAMMTGLIHSGGSTHPFCRLSPAQVREIRATKGNCRSAGRQFNVSAETISRVRRHVTYLDVE